MDVLDLQLSPFNILMNLSIHLFMKEALPNHLEAFFVLPLSQNQRDVTSKQDPDLIAFPCTAG